VGIVTVTSASTLTAQIEIATNAALGPRNRHVDDRDGSRFIVRRFRCHAAVNQTPIVSAGTNQTVHSAVRPGVLCRVSGSTAGSNPAGITTGPDHNVWFTEHFGNK